MAPFVPHLRVSQLDSLRQDNLPGLNLHAEQPQHVKANF